MSMLMNVSNLTAYGVRGLQTATAGIGQALLRLTTGMRINSAADDASGLAISEKMRSQIRGLAVSNRNAQDSISMMQTAEGGLSVMGDMMQRMRELSVQAGNGTLTANDRALIQKEMVQLQAGINSISTGTEFNTKKILTGVNTSSLGLNGVNVTTTQDAGKSITKLNQALESVVGQRATIGAKINRMDYTIRNNTNMRYNLMNAEARIRGADVAQEVTNLVNNTLLGSTATAMLVHANQNAKNVLKLVGW